MKKLIFIFLFIIFPNLSHAWADNVSIGTKIKSIHINELRNVINLKRSCLGLPVSIWIDNSITSGLTPIKAQHFSEIKSSLDDIVARCFTGPSSCTGTKSISGTNLSLSFTKGGHVKAADLVGIRTFLGGITCTPWTYGWLVGSFGACAGGSGTWNYGSWGSCMGVSQNWSYGGWGGCSASCGGGAQSRYNTLFDLAGTGTQTRSAACLISQNSGLQTKAVQCQRNDGVIVADSYCTLAAPVITQSCTPSSNSVCGVSSTSQTCPPSAVANSGQWQSQACNAQACCTQQASCDYGGSRVLLSTKEVPTGRDGNDPFCPRLKEVDSGPPKCTRTIFYFYKGGHAYGNCVYLVFGYPLINVCR